MSEAINNVKQAFDAELAQTDLTNQEAVNNLRVKYLGKKGAVTDLMKQMGTLSAEERPAYGKLVNELKVAVSEAIDKAIETANQAALQKKLESGFVDTTLPGAGIPAGSTHPLYDVREEIIDFFSQMGFEVDFGRDIETDWYNFEALNTPPDHPSRDMQDTFYVDDKVMLRTHTSGTQIHYNAQAAVPHDCSGPRVPRRQRCDPRPDVPAVRRPRGGRKHQLCRPQGRAPGVHEQAVRRRRQDAFPPELLPVHGTFCRNGRELRVLRWQGLPSLQGNWLDGNRRLRFCGPERVQELRHRFREVHGLCIRFRSRPYRDAPPRDSGNRLADEQRPEIPEPVLV